jgi:hypothetical protein
MNGIIVGCDRYQEWLLPWWWSHYSVHNSYPVIFIDMGMSEEGVAWCQEKGACFSLSQDVFSSPKEKLSPAVRNSWEESHGTGIWKLRSAWLKKPFALLHSPFAFTLWLDLDCQVVGELEPLFNTLFFGADLSLAQDPQIPKTLLPGEIPYNSGVLVFRKGAPILTQWIETMMELETQLPGDQDFLSRAIFLHQPLLFELPEIYNWLRHSGTNDKAIINHFSGGLGKIEILKSLNPASLHGIGIPKMPSS